jgi:hypothetical protein
MLPEARANNLLYVFTNYDGVNVFSYPSGKLQGILSPGEELSAGMCVDRNGDVFMTDTTEAWPRKRHCTAHPVTLARLGAQSIQ